jgi:hypothetical protein
MGTANPEVKKVMAYANSKREIPWQRVYGFPRESLVKFQHAPHARAKIECATCHGDMTQAAVAVRLVKHTMGSCLSCHRQYVKFGGSLMPAFRQTLTDSEIDTLIDYIAAK